MPTSGETTVAPTSPPQRHRPRFLIALVIVLGLALTAIIGTAVLLLRDLSDYAGANPLDQPFSLPSGSVAAGDREPQRQPAQVDRIDAPLPKDMRIDEYVALGDSYSSGPGLPDQRNDPVACKRSTRNYPSYLSAWMNVATFRDVTCSGARIQAFLNPQERPDGTRVRPQALALTASVDLVTVGMGGNDAGLFSALVQTCPEVAARDPQGHPCRAELGGDARSSWGDAASLAHERLTAVVREIRQRAPAAQVVVVGYPTLFPPTGETCPQLPFASGDVLWASGQLSRLNAALRQVAVDEGVRYVDLEAASSGHHVCSATPWMAGADRDAPGETWHPLPAGMLGAATAMAEQLGGTTQAAS